MFSYKVEVGTQTLFETDVRAASTTAQNSKGDKK